MSVLTPGATYESQTAVIAKWRDRLLTSAAAIDAKFAGKTFDAYGLYDDVNRAWQIATEFADINNDLMDKLFGPDKRQREIEDITLDLLELKGFLGAVKSGLAARNGYPSFYVFSDGDPYFAKARELQKAPILWLLGGESILKAQRDLDQALTEVADTVANLPAAGIKWTLESLLKSLGLPTWALPVIGVTAIVGVAGWAYFSFLAPVGAASRMLRVRTNPRRRRRIRRKRRLRLR